MIKYGKTKTPVARPVLNGLELTMLIEHLKNTGFEDQYKNIYLATAKIKEKPQTVASGIIKKLKISLTRLEDETTQ